MKAKAPFMISVTSSGSSRSPMAVEPTTSANRTVTSLRSPSGWRGAGCAAGLAGRAWPQLEQNLALSLLAAWQRGQIALIATLLSRAKVDSTTSRGKWRAQKKRQAVGHGPPPVSFFELSLRPGLLPQQLDERLQLGGGHIGDGPKRHARPRPMLHLVTLVHRQLRASNRACRPDEQVDQMLLVPVDQRGHRPIVQIIQPAANQGEALVGQVYHRW